MNLLLELLEQEKTSLYKRWNTLVNMTPAQLKKFLDSDLGKSAGLSKAEASSANISRGRDSARAILRMKGKDVSSWSSADWTWAKKQVSFISRMVGNKGPLYDEDGNPTRKLLSLWVWGHRPKGTTVTS